MTRLTGVMLVTVFLASCGGEVDVQTINSPPTGDTTPPTVLSSTPAAGSAGVSVNALVSANFSEAMNNATLTAATVTLTVVSTGAAVNGGVSINGNTVTLTPAAALLASTQYRATITSGARDVAGNALAANFSWTFTTAAPPDTTPPTVLSTSPLSGATGVALNAALAAMFSEPMTNATLTTSTFTLVVTSSGTPVSGTVAVAGNTATFTPSVPLAGSTQYTATITTGARDAAGNALASAFSWSFTTVPPPDTTPPTVLATSPINGATGVALNIAPTATFSEPMSSATLTTSTFTVVVASSGAPVSGTVGISANTATFTPSGNLLNSTQYRATITTGVRDLANNALAASVTWTFTTLAAPDTTPPTVLAITPGSGATGVALSAAPTATFSEPMNNSTLTNTTFILMVTSSGTPVSGSVGVSGNTATFTPSTALAGSTQFTATITTGARDAAGNALASTVSWSFTTTAPPDTTPPTVLSTSPINGASGVALNAALAAMFSEPMNNTTLTTATFTLVVTSTSTPVSGSVGVSGNTATFTPSAALAGSTQYTATITTGARDVAGNALASNFSWSFTTTLPPDTTPPTVLSTSPLNGATGVALNAALAALFSEPMNNATLTTSTFTVVVTSSGTPVSGTVGVSGNTATFTPSAALLGSTQYSATITTGASDVAGNALASNFSWSFMTAAAPDTTPPTVLSTSPLSGATGVALNAALAAMFSEPMNNTTLTTSTFTLVVTSSGTPVSGTVGVSGSTATFTPSAALAGSTQYTATITTGARDVAGNALASNFTWSFTTTAPPDTTPPTVISITPSSGATGVAIGAAPTASFSEPMNNATLTTSTFTLVVASSGVPVSGTVTTSANTATFTPSGNLLNSTQYQATITTGVSDLAGNALATNVSWTFTTSAAPDTTPPTVLSISPSNGATGVALNSALATLFSEPMNNTTLTTSTFTLVVTSSGTPVSGSVGVSGNTATFTPSAALIGSTQYTATITTGALDAAGNALASNFTWTFTTTTAPDTTPPTVLSTSPVNGASGVALSAALAALFSEPMNNATLTASTFTLAETSSGTPVSGSVGVSGNTATFTPSAALIGSTQYTATITTGALDAAGNALAAPFSWSFTTTAPPDTTPPTVLSTTPVNGASGVALSTAPTATFSEPMNNATLTASTFTLAETSSGTPVSGSVGVSGNTATFTPSAALLGNTQYTATITTGARDVAGNALAGNFSWVFTTTTPPDTTPPTVVSRFPTNGATNVALNSTVMITFSEPMNNATLNTTTFTLVVTGNGAPVPGSVGVSGNTATFTPAANLAGSTQYTATVSTGAQDLAGNAIALPASWSFTTTTPPDTTPPTVSSVTPSSGATGVAVGTTVTATFSEAMDNSTLTTGNFSVVVTSNSAVVSGSINVSGNTATFTPSAALTPSTQYTATLNTSVRDLAGNNLAIQFAWSFTTASGSAPSLGVSDIQFIFTENVATTTQISTVPLTTQSTGSVIVTSVGNGTFTALRAPTDNKGNSYAQVGTAHTYGVLYPDSGTALYADTTVTGGANHVITAPQPQTGQEITFAAVEVRNASTVNAVWNYPTSAPVTSVSVTTTGPAVLIAFWWGDGDGSVPHNAVPNNGFTVIGSVNAAGSLVQCFVATRTVAAAGTYNVTWTSTTDPGAQLYLVAVQ